MLSPFRVNLNNITKHGSMPQRECKFIDRIDNKIGSDKPFPENHYLFLNHFYFPPPKNMSTQGTTNDCLQGIRTTVYSNMNM